MTFSIWNFLFGLAPACIVLMLALLIKACWRAWPWRNMGFLVLGAFVFNAFYSLHTYGPRVEVSAPHAPAAQPADVVSAPPILDTENGRVGQFDERLRDK